MAHVRKSRAKPRVRNDEPHEQNHHMWRLLWFGNAGWNGGKQRGGHTEGGPGSEDQSRKASHLLGETKHGVTPRRPALIYYSDLPNSCPTSWIDSCVRQRCYSDSVHCPLQNVGCVWGQSHRLPSCHLKWQWMTLIAGTIKPYQITGTMKPWHITTGLTAQWEK